MTKPLTRTNSLRKRVRPMDDIYEEEDSQRRDSFGRKRVDVVHCLLDSSSDENDNDNVNIEKTSTILWLTFNEICHIRYILVQASLTTDKQYSQIRNGQICFRCRNSFHLFSFLPSFFHFKNYEICFICKQLVCKKCTYYNFILPAFKHSIPIRIQSLMKSSSIAINENNNDRIIKNHTQTKTLCYDCLQIFNEHLNTSQHRRKPSPCSPLRRTNSLPPVSSKISPESRHTRHRRRPIPVAEV